MAQCSYDEHVKDFRMAQYFDKMPLNDLMLKRERMVEDLKGPFGFVDLRNPLAREARIATEVIFAKFDEERAAKGAGRGIGSALDGN